MSKLLSAIQKWTIVAVVLAGGAALTTVLPELHLGQGSLLCANGCPENIAENREATERMVRITVYVMMFGLAAVYALTERYDFQRS